MKVLHFVVLSGLFFFLFLSFERPAMAYIDPGSGLFLMQGFSSMCVGALFFARRRLKRLVTRSKVKTAEPARFPAAASGSRTDEAAAMPIDKAA